MKIKSYIIVGCAFLLMASAMLSGCGKKEETEVSQMTTEATDSAPTTPTPSEPLEEPKPSEEPEQNEAANVIPQESIELVQVPFSGTVRIAAPKGAAAYGLAKLYKENEQMVSRNAYSFTWAQDALEVQDMLINGDADIVLLPSVMAAELNQITQNQIQGLAVNTLGTLYVLENGNEVVDFKSLKGKRMVITAWEMGTEPILNYIASQNGMMDLSDIHYEWQDDIMQAVDSLVAGDGKLGLLPEPYVSMAMKQNSELRIALDLGAVWSETEAADELSMNVVVCSREFAKANHQEVNAFLDEYRQSTQYAVANPEDEADFVAETGIWPAKEDVLSSLERSNLVFLEGLEMKNTLQTFYQNVDTTWEDSTWKILPDEAFYYDKTTS